MAKSMHMQDSLGFITIAFPVIQEFGSVCVKVPRVDLRHVNATIWFSVVKHVIKGQAVESLPSFPIEDLRPNSVADSLARTLAPNGVQKGRNQSIPGSLEEVDAHPRKRKNPKENKVILGVFVVGDIGLEPTTSTMSTLRSNQLS